MWAPTGQGCRRSLGSDASRTGIATNSGAACAFSCAGGRFRSRLSAIRTGSTAGVVGTDPSSASGHGGFVAAVFFPGGTDSATGRVLQRAEQALGPGTGSGGCAAAGATDATGAAAEELAPRKALAAAPLAESRCRLRCSHRGRVGAVQAASEFFQPDLRGL